MARMLTHTQTAGAAVGGPRTAAAPATTHLRFPGVDLDVALQDAPDVERALAQALRDWHPAVLPGPTAGARQSNVAGSARGYATASVYLEEPLDGLGLAGATCAVIADLAQDYFETRPGTLALHCGAVRFNDRLIAMTGPSRAGKSTLAARLTMEADMQVFCDDVLPLLPDGQAVGLGIAPRLRLPLPPACSVAFRDHVARHMGPGDARYGYLCAPTVAPHGTRAPLSVLLILDRQPQAEARLHAVAEDEALRFLLSQTMSDLVTAEAAFERLSSVLAGIVCLRLVYADLEAAVALIRHAFGGASAPAGDVPIHPPLPPAPPERASQRQVPADRVWSRLGDVTLQRRGDSAFLWQPGQPTIWHLNRLGLAVWALLEIPGTAGDLAAVLAEVFPDQPADRLTRDVNDLLESLSGAGLIEPA